LKERLSKQLLESVSCRSEIELTLKEKEKKMQRLMIELDAVKSELKEVSNINKELQEQLKIKTQEASCLNEKLSNQL
jgi:hypothetical protein